MMGVNPNMPGSGGGLSRRGRSHNYRTLLDGGKTLALAA